jgi:hypothetical protein
MKPVSRDVFSKAVPPPEKRLKPTPPGEDLASVANIETLRGSEGSIDERFIDAYTVSVSDSAYETAWDTHDLNLGTSLKLLPGCYWRIGSILVDKLPRPVFRQERGPDGLNDQQLFFIPTQEGFFISSKIGPEFNKKAKDANTFIHAWAKTLVSDGVHVPFWSKQTRDGVTMMPTHFYADDVISRLEEPPIMRPVGDDNAQEESPVEEVAESIPSDKGEGKGDHKSGKGKCGKKGTKKKNREVAGQYEWGRC